MAYVPPIRRHTAELVTEQFQPRGKLVFLFRGMDVQYPPTPGPARALQDALREAFPATADESAPPDVFAPAALPKKE